ncbi:hypothetical protein CBM2587_A40057 [Cupriavidus taiwanensis]|uniref:Uncharacterized protein n=1 Tax=Cupriavidus taiwanensis TaxID=164546 RepID=A0A375BU17_9BURK|nr:hypothetical protein CBM2587_A40057 [Cupriavidus taiwanensis]
MGSRHSGFAPECRQIPCPRLARRDGQRGGTRGGTRGARACESLQFLREAL